MLQPDNRAVYLDAVRPPPGYRFGEAIATTYSLELSKLLTVPVSLALPGLDARRVGKESAVTLLESIRRVSSKVTLFCNVGSIAAPAGEHVLYGLLEPMVVETRAPLGGCLHAKLWLLAFEPEPDTAGRKLLRLVVLSRNLTSDRSWDVALQLDGEVRNRVRSANRPLLDLVQALPELATRRPSDAVPLRCKRFAEAVLHTKWELPSGFEEYSFRVLGLSTKGWTPPESDKLVVVSPFLSSKTLQALADTSRAPAALISRADELDRIPRAALERFEQVLVMRQEAETADGEEPTGLQGLHAKLYVSQHGRWGTRVALGSGNATGSGIGTPPTDARNIELLVELAGKASKVGGVESLLGEDGMLPLLRRYEPPAEPVQEDAARKRAERELEEVAVQLSSKLEIHFAAADDMFVPTLVVTGKPFALSPAIESARAWLVTVHPSGATEIARLEQMGQVDLLPCAGASATSLVAFELISATRDASGEPVMKLFSSSLQCRNMPPDRDAHVVRVVIDNRERFLQYLLSLLESDDGQVDAVHLDEVGQGTGIGAWGPAMAGLLERLLRARARAPERIEEARSMIQALRATERGRAILSAEFLDLWSTVTGEAP